MAPTLHYHVGDIDTTIVRRSLSDVNHTQAVTLGIIAVYVVVIALLWNLPYVRWSLWPFKVRCLYSCALSLSLSFERGLIFFFFASIYN